MTDWIWRKPEGVITPNARLPPHHWPIVPSSPPQSRRGWRGGQSLEGHIVGLTLLWNLQKTWTEAPWFHSCIFESQVFNIYQYTSEYRCYKGRFQVPCPIEWRVQLRGEESKRRLKESTWRDLKSWRRHMEQGNMKSSLLLGFRLTLQTWWTQEIYRDTWKGRE